MKEEPRRRHENEVRGATAATATTVAFSFRALAVGVCVGAIAAVSNVYVSLKTGWSLPVMSTAVVIGLAVARGQKRALHVREAAVLASLASSAGYMAGGGNIAALPAFVMLGGTAPSAIAMAAWFAAIALLGVLVAPLVGRRIVSELPFPTATATAKIVETLGVGERQREGNEGNNDGNNNGNTEARSLRRAAILSGLYAILRAIVSAPSTFLFPGRAGAYTFGVDTSLLLVGAGGLMTIRTALSTVLGSVLTYLAFAPWLVAHGAIVEPSYREIVRFMVWPAASLLVSSAIAELVLDLPLIFRRRAAKRRLHQHESITNTRAYYMFPILLGVLVVVLEHTLFGISVLHAVLSLPVAISLAYVAGRAMGETDVVPTKALAPLAQVMFGALQGSSSSTSTAASATTAGAAGLVTPAMVPNVTAGVALHAADTLGSLKLSSLLKTPPREALWARALGCVVGAIVVVIAFRAVVPDPMMLPTRDLPVPGVLVWKSVLEVVASGNMPALTRGAIAVGALLGITMTLLTRKFPAHAPSAMGLASGMVLPASNGLAIALGGLVRWVYERRRRGGRSDDVGGDGARGIATASASGVVAGESVVGLVLQILASR